MVCCPSGPPRTQDRACRGATSPGRTVSLGVFPEQYIDADPEVLGIDAVVDEVDQPGGREDRPGGVRLVCPREDQQDVAVVDYREGNLSPERPADLGEAEGEEMILLG